MQIDSAIVEQLVQTGSVLLDEMDFTRKNCSMTDPVGSVVRVSTIENLRGTITAARGVMTALEPKRCPHNEPSAATCPRCIASMMKAGKLDDLLKACPYCGGFASTRTSNDPTTLGCHNGNCYVNPLLKCYGGVKVEHILFWNTRA